MATVSPDYQQRGQFNPYYTLKSAVIAAAHTALVKKYKDQDQKFTQKDLFFKCVDQGSGELIYSTSSRAAFTFQIALDKKENLIPYYIKGAQTSAVAVSYTHLRAHET